MSTRRGFLGAILAAGVAPAFVGSKILMPVRAIAQPWEPWKHIGVHKELPRAPFTKARMTYSGDLRIGDRISIGGYAQVFVVTSLLGSGSANLAIA